MKRSYRFARQLGSTTCQVEDGRTVELPIFAGILKHPLPSELADLLRNPAVARKYTREALRKGAWPIVRAFPRWWLLACLEELPLRAGRRAALEFMLDEPPARSETA